MAKGDTVYIGDPSTRRISWKVRVSYLLRMWYDTKRQALVRLRDAYGLYAADLNYYHRDPGRPEEGYLLACAPIVIRNLDWSIPAGVRFGQNGYRELPAAELRSLGVPKPDRRVLAAPPAWYAAATTSGDAVRAEAGHRYIPLHVRKAVFARDGGRCLGCRTEYGLHLDHVVPFSRGGAATVDNLRLVCAPANLRRGVRPVHEPLWCTTKQANLGGTA